MSDDPLRVVLCWHMHQPDYRDPLTGEWLAPWTYLHGLKDYSDMAAHLENAPESVRAVVNLPPLLLEQIADYAQRIEAWLDSGTEPGDPLLAALLASELPGDREARRALLDRCLHANQQHMIERFPAYARLVRITREALASPVGPDYLTDRHLSDLVTWYHLAWLGEIVRRQDERIRPLLEKGEDFSLDDRRQLVEVIGEILSGIEDRYEKLATDGRIELSTSPYAHPMLPLLLDFGSAREPRPEVTLPACERYPGGAERAAWQLERARNYCEENLGEVPKGCWPSEGGVSAATLRLIGEQGFTWAASGQAVLHHSLEAETPDSDALHRPYRLEGTGPACFFRDDELSDRIGFVYNDWHADDAVDDLVARLERIAAEGGSGRVVPIILDGENPWEHYPHNGIHFVPALYSALTDHPRLHLTTFSEALADPAVEVMTLPQLVAGSWVYGDFGTWIGDPDKNRAWDLLCAAKAVCDRRLPKVSDADRRTAIERQLAVCESSDWFWWFGDYNPENVVAEFDRLYRGQLKALYTLLDETPPADLEQEVSHGHGRPELGGTMRRGSE